MAALPVDVGHDIGIAALVLERLVPLIGLCRREIAASCAIISSRSRTALRADVLSAVDLAAAFSLAGVTMDTFHGVSPSVCQIPVQLELWIPQPTCKSRCIPFPPAPDQFGLTDRSSGPLDCCSYTCCRRPGAISFLHSAKTGNDPPGKATGPRRAHSHLFTGCRKSRLASSN